MTDSWRSLPQAFRDRARRMLAPDDLERWQRAFDAPPPMAVRFTGKGEGGDRFERMLQEADLSPRPVGFLADAFHLEQGDRSRVRALPWAQRGDLVLQAASSMAAPCALAPRPGEDVLDLCAAPGGKTALLHKLMRGEGRLVANDVSRRRLARLQDQLDQLGIEDIQMLRSDGAKLARDLSSCFDRVLVDAPCSGDGRWHAGDASAWARWTASTPRQLARRQRSLLSGACAMVRPGGRVVYATCTLSPEENEGVLDGLLASGSVECVDLPFEVPGGRPPLTQWEGRTFDSRIGAARRIAPGCSAMTGFFIAALQRR